MKSRARVSTKQRHLDRAEIISSYADAFKKWKWLIWPISATVAGSPLTRLILSYLSKFIGA